MPLPPSRRLAAITLTCLLASGEATVVAPLATALPAATASSAFEPGSSSRPAAASDSSTLSGAQTYYNALLPGEYLLPGESLASSNGAFTFEMQDDGNVVLSADSGAPVWSTGTHGSPGATLLLDGDGRPVVYRTDSSIAWSSRDTRPAVQDILVGGQALRSEQQLTSSDGRSRAELRARFEALGVSEDAPVGVYCGSGISADALTLAGFAPALYPGSWSQWANTPGRPVATGPNA
ncbi:hypothetical protein [Rathayibacter rathayi]|uniref:hypothetical protein n=1 Tax=Rathayibacter rathayi TaxID=33887 RepID=UPI0021586675|nr:hypothetical protein [Rathayibacter rathayi]